MQIPALKVHLILPCMILLLNMREFLYINFLVEKKIKELVTDYTVSIGNPEKMAMMH